MLIYIISNQIKNKIVHSQNIKIVHSQNIKIVHSQNIKIVHSQNIKIQPKKCRNKDKIDTPNAHIHDR
jgi:hypothetical protein